MINQNYFILTIYQQVIHHGPKNLLFNKSVNRFQDQTRHI